MKKKLSLEIGSYEGEVNKKDEPHGKGVLSNPSEFTKYIGEFVNGKKHGKGTLKYLDEIRSQYNEINKKLPKGYVAVPIHNPPSMLEYIGEFKDDKYDGLLKFNVNDTEVSDLVMGGGWTLFADYYKKVNLKKVENKTKLSDFFAMKPTR
jgi:hypothetical protein